MKLTLVISSLNSGGAERVISELANYWALNNHQVTLVTLASPESPPFYPLNSSINLIQLDQNHDESSLLARLRNILRRIFSLRKTIRTLTPDVVISFVTVTNIATLLATRGLKIPVIVSERIDPNFHKLPGLYTWLRFKIYPYCHRLIMQTESAARYFPVTFEKFIRIIPNAVNSRQKQNKILPERVRKIVSIGRLDPQKDHTILIKAFSKVIKDYPDLSLTIYGEGIERANLERLIDSLRLQRHIFLPGITKNIHEVLIDADLFAFPSLYEGFPNALCEAMSVGLPVIASNCSGNTEVVQDGVNGKLFPVGDEDALAKKILELLEDDKQRKGLGENARKVSASFHPDRILPLWDQVISEVTHSHS